ncbi:MAG TPA: DUF222 domain-containing protein [Lapillicoccus sp.]|nr:DUF222 domain-containing protein [Lapillicoccus sp.]
MFESGKASTRDLERLVAALSGFEDAADDAERVTQLDLLERVKAACAAAQARVTVELAESQAALAEEWRQSARTAAAVGDFDAWRAAREAMRRSSCPEADDEPRGSVEAGRRPRGRRPRAELGVAAQVALARRESPHTGSRLVRFAFALTHEMPFLLSLLERGVVSERRALLVVQECAALTREQHERVDAELRHTVGEQLGRMSAAELTSRVRAITYRLDAQAVVDRAAYAERERRVTLRPAPDTMCWLTALLPATQGVGVLAALTQAADAARAAGDTRGRGQVMADTLVERVTGQASAAGVSVEVQVVLTDRALLAGDATPAVVPGYGTVPAEWARRMVRREPEGPVQVWIRRLYTHPDNGALVAMDSRRRVFDGSLRRLLVARDGGIRRTPGCGAPIRHVDHVTPHAAGGATASRNGQGLCVRCNLVKELLGWWARVAGGGEAHTVEITTPTGHRYRSNAPPVVHEDPGISASALERVIEHALAA